MSGRPFITGWAQTPDYPSSANPWSTTPTKVTPAYAFFTPSVAYAPSAQEMNDILATRDGYSEALLAWCAQQDGLNWRLGVDLYSGPLGSYGTQVDVSGTYYNQVAFAYDSTEGLWVAVQFLTGPYLSFNVSFDGQQWALINELTPSSNLNSIRSAFCGPGVVVALFNVTGDAGGVASYPTNGSAAAMSALTNLFAVQGTYFDGLYLVWGGTTAYHSADAATWTAVSGSLAITTSNIFCQSATDLLLFPAGASPTEYLLSTTGTSYAATTFGSPITLTGYTITGASYDANSGTYVVVANNGSATKVLTSTTAASGSWSSATIPHVCTTICCNGTEWLLVASVYPTPNDTSGHAGPGPGPRLLLSIDQGATWRFTGPMLADPGVPGDTIPNGPFTTTGANGVITGIQILTSGTQFLAWSNRPETFSGAHTGFYWFSHATGAPPALTF